MEVESDTKTLDQIRDVNEHYFEQGWTDGLPVVPPTQARVDRFLEVAGLDAAEIVMEYPSRHRQATAQMLAVNAVMAGCRPEYFPVVVAAARAVTAPEFLLNHIATTSSAFPLIIVNGPRAKRLGFNSGQDVFGSGNRANATVGRALSLILANCFDARIGGIQGGNQGHPGRYGFCIAENEETGWVPLHVQRGFGPKDTVVTVFPSQAAPFPIESLQHRSAEQAAEYLAAALLRIAPALTFYVIVISPQLQRVFLEQGWTKEDVRRYLFEHSRMSVADLKRCGRWKDSETKLGFPATIRPEDERRLVFPFKRNEYRREIWHDAELRTDPDLLVVSAGGDEDGHGYIVTSHAAGPQPVSRLVV